MTTPPHPPQRPPLHATTTYTYTYTYTSSFTSIVHHEAREGHTWTPEAVDGARVTDRAASRGRGGAPPPPLFSASSLLLFPFSSSSLSPTFCSERGRAWRTVWTGLAGGAGSSSFSGGRRMARKFSSSSGRAGRRAWAGNATGAGHLRRVEASGGVGLLRWPAPPPSSSGGRGPRARGVAVAGWRWPAGGRGRAARPGRGTSGGLRRAVGWGSSGGLLLLPPPLAAGGRGRTGWPVAGWRWRGRAGWRSRGGRGRGARGGGGDGRGSTGRSGAAELGGAARGG
ncbi:uncharacterized protein [Miscanthus floridulus]|uniref:uncharacterized protein n=1 Tax=Miscanthus floridulus TaxID=154761 RepID=UPI0034586884